MLKFLKKYFSFIIILVLLIAIGIISVFSFKTEEAEPQEIEYKISIDEEALNFIFITDLHIDSSEEDYNFVFKQLELIKSMALSHKLDFIAIGGDLYNGMVMTSKEDAFKLLDSVALFFKDLEIPILILKGNHDDNSYNYYYERDSYYDRNPDYILSPEEFYNHTMKYYEEYISGYQDNYFYIDFEKKNTRVVCLNSTDYEYKIGEQNKLLYSGRLDMGYTDEQMKWLTQIALADSSMNYLFLAHDYQDQFNYRKNNNITTLFSIIKSLSNHQSYDNGNVFCDFTGYKSKVIAYICGHMHADCVFYSKETDCHVMRIGSAKIEKDALSSKQEAKGFQRYNDREYSAEFFLFDVISVTDNLLYTQRIGIGNSTWFVF